MTLIGRPRRALTERFWEKVERTEGCWLWRGALERNGYGRIVVGGRNGGRILVHRLSYELANGPIPEGLDIDHLCRNRACVNPAHLEAVTRRENLLRGETHAARNAGKTHCPHGHPYDEANTYVRREGGRACRACGRARPARAAA